jgi:hypothetical protein
MRSRLRRTIALVPVVATVAVTIAACTAVEPIIRTADHQASSGGAPWSDCEHVASVDGFGMGQSSAQAVVVAAFYATALQMAAWQVGTTHDDWAAEMYLDERPRDRTHVLCYVEGEWGELPSGAPIQRIAADLGLGNLVLWEGTKEQVKISDPADYTLPDRLLRDDAFSMPPTRGNPNNRLKDLLKGD